MKAPIIPADEPSAPVRILLVDDHTIIRSGLRLSLSQAEDLQVVGEAGNRRTALERVKQLEPQVVVMDIGLPDVDGIDLSRELLVQAPQLRVIILSAIADQEHLDRALAAKVSGYLLKTNGVDELMRAIRKGNPREPYLAPEVAAVLLHGYQRLRESRQAETETTLTERECEVLQLVVDGRNTKEIAAEIGISTKTVDTHRARVMAKLGLQSVAELTKYAIRMGYTSI